MKLLRILHPIVFIAFALAAFSFATMWLWNALLPPLFPGVSEVSFFQAMGLLVLSRILFSGIGGKMRGFGHLISLRERRAMYEKWKQMPQQERDQLIEKTRTHFQKASEEHTSEH